VPGGDARALHLPSDDLEHDVVAPPDTIDPKRARIEALAPTRATLEAFGPRPSPLADREHHDAQRHADAMQRHRAELLEGIARLEQTQDELLDRLVAETK